MAGDWIKVEENMPDKPEVYGMAAQLGIEVDAAQFPAWAFWLVWRKGGQWHQQRILA
jgi:hypothetical protein